MTGARTPPLGDVGPGGSVLHGDTLALALAISPLALSLPALSRGSIASLSVLPALISAQAILMLFDRRSLEASGGPPAALPSPALFLLPGAYLADRARGLGRSDDLVWTWICTMLHSIAILALAAAMLTRDADPDVQHRRAMGPILVEGGGQVGGSVATVAPRRGDALQRHGFVVGGRRSHRPAWTPGPTPAAAREPGG